MFVLRVVVLGVIFFCLGLCCGINAADKDNRRK